MDYVKATIETLNLIEFFLLRLNRKHRLDDFNSILQEILERSTQGSKSEPPIDISYSNPVRQVRSPENYWLGAYNISKFMKTQWNEKKEFKPFIKVLREKRDYYSIQILSDAISPLNSIIDTFFIIHEGILHPPDIPQEEEDDLLSRELRKIIPILRNAED
ncbi:MAG: hypothetical protein ACFFAJ_09245 [Candidatus Hodarchaeota archaeon]